MKIDRISSFIEKHRKDRSIFAKSCTISETRCDHLPAAEAFLSEESGSEAPTDEASGSAAAEGGRRHRRQEESGLLGPAVGIRGGIDGVGEGEQDVRHNVANVPRIPKVTECNLRNSTPLERGNDKRLAQRGRQVSSPIVQPQVNWGIGSSPSRVESGDISKPMDALVVSEHPKPLALVEKAIDRASKKRGLDPQASYSALSLDQKKDNSPSSSEPLSRAMDLSRRASDGISMEVPPHMTEKGEVGMECESSSYRIVDGIISFGHATGFAKVSMAHQKLQELMQEEQQLWKGATSLFWRSGGESGHWAVKVVRGMLSSEREEYEKLLEVFQLSRAVPGNSDDAV
ncbi:hypothetical protein QJS10_CPA10g01006 [Acorus calamus]|uniref:Uncharacterized protein n=1 Tax=Acorus calamus TaxID=4465 RepID=A0AAV9E092_ACOCL|nr:hypothetical protein QJS10_CPA10g01006 [Acorus calamus]